MRASVLALLLAILVAVQTLASVLIAIRVAGPPVATATLDELLQLPEAWWDGTLDSVGCDACNDANWRGDPCPCGC